MTQFGHHNGSFEQILITGFLPWLLEPQFGALPAVSNGSLVLAEYVKTFQQDVLFKGYISLKFRSLGHEQST